MKSRTVRSSKRIVRKAQAAVRARGSRSPNWVRDAKDTSSPTQRMAKSRRAPQPQVGGGFQVLGIDVKFHEVLLYKALAIFRVMLTAVEVAWTTLIMLTFTELSRPNC